MFVISKQYLNMKSNNDEQCGVPHKQQNIFIKEEREDECFGDNENQNFTTTLGKITNILSIGYSDGIKKEYQPNTQEYINNDMLKAFIADDNDATLIEEITPNLCEFEPSIPFRSLYYNEYVAYIRLSLTFNIFERENVTEKDILLALSSFGTHKNNERLGRDMYIMYKIINHTNRNNSYKLVYSFGSLVWNDFVLSLLRYEQLELTKQLNVVDNFVLPKSSRIKCSEFYDTKLAAFKWLTNDYEDVLFQDTKIEPITQFRRLVGNPEPRWPRREKIEKFIKLTQPDAISITGTACVGKTTLLQEITENIEKRFGEKSTIMKSGQYGEYSNKDEEQSRAMSYQAAMLGIARANPYCVTDRSPYDNLMWRVILTNIKDFHTTSSVGGEIDVDTLVKRVVDTIDDLISPQVISAMEMAPIIYIVDSDTKMNRERMKRRNSGSDARRYCLPYYVEVQNLVYFIFAYITKSIIIDIGTNPLNDVINPLKFYIIEKIKKDNRMYRTYKYTELEDFTNNSTLTHKNIRGKMYPLKRVANYDYSKSVKIMK